MCGVPSALADQAQWRGALAYFRCQSMACHQSQYKRGLTALAVSVNVPCSPYMHYCTACMLSSVLTRQIGTGSVPHNALHTHVHVLDLGERNLTPGLESM